MDTTDITDTLEDIRRQAQELGMSELRAAQMMLLTDPLLAARYFYWKTYGSDFLVGEHHHKIAQALNDVLQGRTKRLIINMPPRYGKTELAVRAFIAMGLAINPAAKFMHISYSDDVALDNSHAIRDMVMSEWYGRLFPYVRVDRNVRAKKKWYIQKYGGGMYATSMLGQITGFGAGLLDTANAPFNFGGAIVIDDPLKVLDAQSAATRDTVNQVFESTIRTRANNANTPIIIIMQRLHKNDLCGYLIDLEPNEWKVLSLPAIIKDEHGNEKSLWEHKYSLSHLKQIERGNRFVFQTQYMQNPVDSKSMETRWCFAFDRNKNVGRANYNADHPVILSFDFNRNPLACTAWQHHDRTLFCIAAIGIENATTRMMCQEIERRYPNAILLVTGDISGKTATTISHMNNFEVIQNYFHLSNAQMQYSGANPRLADSRYFVNAVFEQYPIILDEKQCEALIFDLENVQADDENKLVKTSRSNLAQRADFLDTMRYVLHRFFKNMPASSRQPQEEYYEPRKITSAAMV